MQTVTVNSKNKDDAYIATVLLFNNIKHLCFAGLGEWRLTESYTSVDNDEYITAYTNGNMFIRADSVSGNHTYTFGSEDS